MQLNKTILLPLFLGITLLITGCSDKQDSVDSKKPSKEAQKVTKSETKEPPKVDEATGFIIDDGYELVIGNCTSCHSSALVTQNRGDKATWNEMIVWMQATQGLWPLGDQKEPILNYLAKNYGPTKASRRSNIEVIDWHEVN